MDGDGWAPKAHPSPSKTVLDGVWMGHRDFFGRAFPTNGVVPSSALESPDWRGPPEGQRVTLGRSGCSRSLTLDDLRNPLPLDTDLLAFNQCHACMRDKTVLTRQRKTRSDEHLFCCPRSYSVSDHTLRAAPQGVSSTFSSLSIPCTRWHQQAARVA